MMLAEIFVLNLKDTKTYREIYICKCNTVITGKQQKPVHLLFLSLLTNSTAYQDHGLPQSELACYVNDVINMNAT